MLDRLVGLETEYALRFHMTDAGGRRVSNAELFERILRHLRTRTPIVAAILRPNGWFVGNGGSLKFECLSFYKALPSAGFVEGATPECRGPLELLRYQRAEDVLLSRAAAASGESDGEVTLLKN